MSDDTQGLDEILGKHLNEIHLKAGHREKLEQAILGWVDEVVIGEPISYNKYGKCPSCTAEMMYQCTCDSGSSHTVTRQRDILKQYGYKSKDAAPFIGKH